MFPYGRLNAPVPHILLSDMPQEKVLDVSEIFVSLQGEGTLAGIPTFFVRLSGCNLRCNWCDTSYAQKPSKNFISIEEIVRHWEKAGKIPYVQITGGEPLLQENVYDLMDFFLKEGVTLLLETNGSISLRKVPKEVIKILDLKTPSSGMTPYMRYENLAYLGTKDQVKFVIADRVDYEWAKKRMSLYYLPVYTQVLFSPAWGLMNPQELANWIIEERLPVRFQLQLHKILWGEKRGV